MRVAFEGLNVRNMELVVSADVDPYFYALLDVVFKIDEEGAGALELDEAYALSTGLPAGLQLKIGQFFTELGRGDALHPHAWEILAAPAILARAFGGDGWRGHRGDDAFSIWLDSSFALGKHGAHAF